MRKGVLLLVFLLVSWVLKAQHDCPAIPVNAVWDTVCFNLSDAPLLLPQGHFGNKYNGAQGQSAIIPENRPTWALSIAHAALLEQGLNGTNQYPRMSFWMATVTQESQWRCDDVYPGGATWDGGKQYSPIGLMVPAVGDDGCFQIEGINNGSAYGALIQYYPLRFRKNEHPNLIGHGNFETAALTKVYYDLFTERIAQYRWGWTYMETVASTCDPYAYEKLAASAYNGGIYGFQNASTFMGNNSCYWTGLPSTTAGYATQVGDMMSVLEQNASYPVTTINPMSSGSSFLGYYSEDISWSVILDYFDAIDDLYWEVDFAGYVLPRVKSKWEQLAGSTTNTINFQQLRPIINEIILSLPREDAMAAAMLIDGAPEGPNGVGCSGDVIPYVTIQPKGNTTYCFGLTLEMEAVVQGGGGAAPTYQWFVGGMPIPGETNKKISINKPVGTYTYNVEVCNGSACNMSACDIDVVVEDCGGCGMLVSATSTNTECKGMFAGAINYSITGNSSNNYTIGYEGKTSVGDIKGSIQTSIVSGSIPKIPDGDYNLIVIDNTNPSCKAYTNETVVYNTYVNEYVQAQITDITNCEAEIEANIVELPSPCQFKVQVGRAKPNWPVAGDTTNEQGWEQWVNAIIQPSNGGAQTVQVNVIDESFQYNSTTTYKADYGRYYFTMNTGDSINLFSQTLNGVPGATQKAIYKYQIFDEADNVVFTGYSIPGTSSQGDTIALGYVGTYRATCPYDPPAYNFTWSPILSQAIPDTDIHTEGKAPVLEMGDVQYVVTAVNKDNPACVYKDSVLVVEDPSCGVVCYDPGTISLRNGAKTLTGTVNLCSNELNGGYALTVAPTGVGSFQYELFKNNASLVGPTTNNVFNITSEGDYYVKVVDAANPTETACHVTSNTISIVLDGPVLKPYCIGSPVYLKVGDTNPWSWFEANGTSTIGTHAGGDSVLWTTAPQTAGVHQVTLGVAPSTTLGTAVSGAFTSWADVGGTITFQVLKPVVLKSASVNINGIWGVLNYSVVIGGDMSLTVPKTRSSTVTLDIEFPVGTYTLTIPEADATGGFHVVQSPASSIAGYVNITGSNSPFRNLVFDAAGTVVTTPACYPALLDIEAKNCCVAPVITTQPVNETTCAGIDKNFTVASSTTGTTYQWQVSTNNGATWQDATNGINYAGVTTGTFTVKNPSVTSPALKVRAKVTAAGCSINSAEVSLTVNALPTFTVSNPASQCGGSVNVASNVTALSPSSATLTYYTALTGGSTVTSTTASSTTLYVAATANGCTSTPRKAIIVNIDAPITLTTPTTGLAVCSSATVNITSTATPVSATLSYHQGAGGTGTVVSNATAIASSGTYSVKAVNGSCESTKDIIVTVDPTPTATITSTALEYCEGTAGVKLAAQAESGATYNWHEWNGTAITGASLATGQAPTFDFTGTKNYVVVVSKGTCSVTSAPKQVIQKLKPSGLSVATTNNKTSYCAGSTYNLTASTNSSPAVTYAWSGAGTSTTAIQAGNTAASASPYSYKVVADAAGCKDSVSVAIMVTSNPSGEMSGTAAICDDGVTTTNVTTTITTGTSPYAFDLLLDGNTFKSITGTTGTHQEAVTGDGTYTAINLTDVNGCVGTITALAVIRYNNEVSATASTLCNADTPLGGVTLSGTQFQMVVTIAQGDTSSISITETSAFGTVFTETTLGSGVWYSGAIDETNTVAVDVKDGNNCNTVSLSANTQCSCPASGNSVLDAATICEEGTTNLVVNYGGGSGNYTITVTQPDNTTQQDANVATTSSTFAVTQKGNYTVAIESIADGNCVVNGGSVNLNHHVVPEATLTGGAAFCNNGTDNSTLTINLTKGIAPFDVALQGTNGFVTRNVTGITTGHTEQVQTASTFTLANVKDANGCVGTSTSSISIEGVALPSATIAAPKAVANNATESFVFSADNQGVTADALSTGYRGEWTLTSVLGSGLAQFGPSTTSATGNSISNIAIDDQVQLVWTVRDDNSVCPSASATLNLERKNVTKASVTGFEACNDINGQTLTGNTLIQNETAVWSVSALSSFSALTLTPSANGEEATISNFTMPAQGFVDIIFDYQVTSPLDPFNPSFDTMLVRVYATPTADAGTAETICGTDHQLQAQAITIGAGKWTSNNAGVTFDDDSKEDAIATNLQDGATEFTWTVTNGTCPPATSKVIITKSGNITSPNPQVDKTIVCVKSSGVQLSGNNPASGETSAWSVNPTAGVTLNTTANQAAASASFTASGSYEFIYTIENGTCNPKAVKVLVEVKDTASLTGINFVGACEGANVTAKALGATNVEAYAWNMQDGGSIVSSLTDEATVLLETGGTTTATVQVTPSNAVCGDGVTLSEMATISTVPRGVGAITGATEICSSVTPTASYSVAAHSDVLTQYKWTVTGLAGLVLTENANAVDIDFGASASGEAEITVTLSNTCGDGEVSLPYKVTSIPKSTPSVDLSASIIEFCEGVDDVKLTAIPISAPGNAPTYEFFVDGTSSGQLVVDNFTAKPTQASVRVVMTSNSTCLVDPLNPTAEKTIVLTPVKAPTLTNTGTVTSACEGENVQLLGTGTPKSSKAETFQWFEDGVALVGKNQSNLLIGTVGEHDYHFEYNNGVCPTVTSNKVSTKVWETPKIDKPTVLTNDQAIVAIDKDNVKPFPISVTAQNLVADAASVTVNWVGEGIVDVSAASTEVILKEEGTYEYLVTMATGTNKECIDQYKFTLIGRVPLLVPNTFSPNGDQINDTWVIPGTSTYDKAHLVVFNRWGQKVHEFRGQLNTTNGWDGGNYPVGTYYYILNLNTEDYPVITGGVTITR